jgi:hypothetical protein
MSVKSFVALPSNVPIAGFSANESLRSISIVIGAIQLYTNITSVTLTPMAVDLEFFTEALRALANRPSLSRLTVDRSCMEEPNAHVLATICGLRELELLDPTPIILNLLPEWLGRLSKSLVALHLTVHFKPFIITTQSLTLVLGLLY